MKAYQIVIKGNERSEKYAEISRQSFEPLINIGIIDEIITFDAITPESENFEEHVNLYSWKPSLMLADLQGSKPEDHSPTEKAGMCSHWELMRMQGESDERFLVLEHDTVLIPEQLDIFCELVELIEDCDILYGNIGLFMGCYTLRPDVAKWQYEMLLNGRKGVKFPINCGPYCTLQRLFRTYCTEQQEPYDFYGRDFVAIHPYHNCNTLYIGNDIGIPFNKFDPAPLENKWKTPSTQVLSKSMKVTQDHHGYPQQHIDEPWRRHNFFQIVD